MKPLHVGQRVRIVYPWGKCHGMTATIWDIGRGSLEKLDGSILRDVIYHRVDVDGTGRLDESGCCIAYERHELIPIYDGDESSEQTFAEIMDKLKAGKLPALEDV